MRLMSKEVPLQSTLFSSELVDTRTSKQKKKAKAAEAPRQVEMFSQRQLAVFGANGRPRLPISPKTRIELAIQDARSQEEIERQLQREIEENTYPMPWAVNQLATEPLEAE
jgi:hypothetical protein